MPVGGSFKFQLKVGARKAANADAVAVVELAEKVGGTLGLQPVHDEVVGGDEQRLHVVACQGTAASVRIVDNERHAR